MWRKNAQRWYRKASLPVVVGGAILGAWFAGRFVANGSPKRNSCQEQSKQNALTEPLFVRKSPTEFNSEPPTTGETEDETLSARRWRERATNPLVNPDSRLKREADAQLTRRAALGIHGHVGRNLGTFEGVGWSTVGPSGVPTCVPSPGQVQSMQPVYDVTVHGIDGFYRMRVWK